MAELNPTLFEDIPETTKLLSSDKAIAFVQDSTGSLVPTLVPISDFSRLLISSEPNIDALKEREKELLKKAEEAKKYLMKTFETKKDSDAAYVTSTKLNKIINKIETVSNFNKAVKDKADDDYLNNKKSNLMNQIKTMKDEFGKGRWGLGDDIGNGYKLLTISRAWTIIKDRRLEVPKEG